MLYVIFKLMFLIVWTILLITMNNIADDYPVYSSMIAPVNIMTVILFFVFQARVKRK